MSTPAGIAAVSAVLRARLEQRLASARVSEVIGPVVVTAAAPADARSMTAESNRLVVFFLHAFADPAVPNVPAPGVPSGGGPPLALQLVYLVAASGAESYAAELLLGQAMSELHRNPIIDGATVSGAARSATSPTAPLNPVHELLTESRLADQSEPLRIVPFGLAIDELSRLWQALGAPYRPSVAYQVGPLLIDGDG